MVTQVQMGSIPTNETPTTEETKHQGLTIPVPPKQTPPTGTFHRVTVAGDEITTESSEKLTQASGNDFLGTGILGTARNGGALTDNVHSKSVVDTPLGNMEVRTAHRMGLVGKGSTGEYYELTPEEVAQAANTTVDNLQQKPEEDKNPFEDFTDIESRHSMEHLTANLPESNRDALMNKTAANLVNAPLDEDNNPIGVDLREYADLAGIDEEQFKQQYHSIVAGFQEQADNALKQTGVDPAEFYDWMKANDPERLKQALTQHYYTRSPAVWKTLVPKFRMHLAPTEEALTERGIKVDKVGKEEVITINGIQMPVKVAARVGLI